MNVHGWNEWKEPKQLTNNTNDMWNILWICFQLISLAYCARQNIHRNKGTNIKLWDDRLQVVTWIQSRCSIGSIKLLLIFAHPMEISLEAISFLRFLFLSCFAEWLLRGKESIQCHLVDILDVVKLNNLRFARLKLETKHCEQRNVFFFENGHTGQPDMLNRKK